MCTVGTAPIPNEYSHSKSPHTSRNNANTFPSKALGAGGQCKLPGFRLGGPWPSIQPYSLGVLVNYSGAVCESRVTLIREPLFRGSGSACVPEFRAWKNGYEGVCALGEQWPLYPEWGPVRLFGPWQADGITTWKDGTRSAVAVDVRTLGPEPRNPLLVFSHGLIDIDAGEQSITITFIHIKV